jgi:hypothetical protein
MVVTEDDAKDAIIANTKPNTDPIYKNREVWAFNRATSQILYHHKVYGLFQAHFFFKTGDSKLPDHHDQGVCILVGLSLFLAFLLLLFLW